MRGKYLTTVMLIGLTAAMSFGCAPAKAPSPAAQAPPATPIATPAPVQAMPRVSAEDAAWAGVVQAARKEGKLTVYSFFLLGDAGTQVKKAFENSTGIRLEIITGTGAPFIERIKAERRGAVQVASVFDSSVVLLFQAKQEGLTQPVGYLPILADESAWAKSARLDPDSHILSTGPTLQTPWINTRLLKPDDAPRSWKDMLQARWKGKIDFPDPDTTPSAVRMFFYLTKYAGLDDAYFQQLGKQVVLSANTLMSAESVVRGEVPLAFVSSAASMRRFLAEGAPVKAIDIEEGVVAIQSYSFALLNGAPAPNAGRVFLNWLLSKEGQTIYHQANGTNSFRKDVPAFEPPPAQLAPRKTIWATAEEEREISRIQRDRTLKKLLTGK